MIDFLIFWLKESGQNGNNKAVLSTVGWICVVPLSLCAWFKELQSQIIWIFVTPCFLKAEELLELIVFVVIIKQFPETSDEKMFSIENLKEDNTYPNV